MVRSTPMVLGASNLVANASLASTGRLLSSIVARARAGTVMAIVVGVPLVSVSVTVTGTGSSCGLANANRVRKKLPDAPSAK